MLRGSGRRRSKRGESIDDTLIKHAITEMREYAPMLPNEERFKDKVRHALRRAQPPTPTLDDLSTMVADLSCERAELLIDLRAAHASRANKK
jgi:hypothetical protein